MTNLREIDFNLPGNQFEITGKFWSQFPDTRMPGLCSNSPSFLRIHLKVTSHETCFIYQAAHVSVIHTLASPENDDVIHQLSRPSTDKILRFSCTFSAIFL